MNIHVLNGDALAQKFPIEQLGGETVIFRECLMDGPVAGETWAEFWQARSVFIGQAYGESPEGYRQQVTEEIEKLQHVPENAAIHLWFENDLFCQVNMWFILALLEPIRHKKLIYRVFPIVNSIEDQWRGFGPAGEESLLQAYRNRILFSESDIQLGKRLWDAYQRGDREQLTILAKTPSDCFPYLQEVCQAHLDRLPVKGQKSRPEAVLEEIMQSGTTEFPEVFRAFFERMGIYGFGDLQVKKLYDTIHS